MYILCIFKVVIVYIIELFLVIQNYFRQMLKNIREREGEREKEREREGERESKK